MISLLVEQSHAFKLMYSVMNFAEHLNSGLANDSVIFNSNYIFADGSKSGKTTSDLALYFVFIFYVDDSRRDGISNFTPVMVQNIKAKDVTE